MKALTDFYHNLWHQYIRITPQARDIHQLFINFGEVPVNDHVAFRTFADSVISLEILEPKLLDFGFQYFDEYHFEQKHLYARSYVHPLDNTKIFLSEILWHELSRESQDVIGLYLSKIEKNTLVEFTSGRLWPTPSLSDYKILEKESEYAAWLLAWGLRANHFTIYINALNKFTEIEKVVGLLENQGYSLNAQGGVIKGSVEQGLMQISTMADEFELEFRDGEKETISSCYYEFAQRFNPKNRSQDKDVYQGFVVSSANNIFESTSKDAK